MRCCVEIGACGGSSAVKISDDAAESGVLVPIAALSDAADVAVGEIGVGDDDAYLRLQA